MRPINADGLTLIKSFESFRAHAYQDSGGVWTIGYGHTNGVTSDSPDITREQAEVLLRNDLANVIAAVEKTIHVSLTDNQFSALVSLAYNAGTAPLIHTLGSLLNAGDYVNAAEQFLKWNHVGGAVSNGLTRRREAEKTLFCKED